MDKKDILIGFVIGILASILGTYLFITLFTGYDYINGVQSMRMQGNLGKLITLGSILDLVAFGILLKMYKEMMARGVVLAVIVIAIITIFA